MTRDVQLLSPDDSLMQAARCMRDDNIGSLPVSEGDRLVGYVTDRDLVVRGLAEGFSGNTYIHNVMINRMLYCFEDVALNMAHNQVRRLPVLSRDKRHSIVALGNLATKAPDRAAEDAPRAYQSLPNEAAVRL